MRNITLALIMMAIVVAAQVTRLPMETPDARVSAPSPSAIAAPPAGTMIPSMPTTKPIATANPPETLTTTPVPSPSRPRLLFGVGPEADSATRTRLAQEVQLHMLTSWYTGPGDLRWMVSWHHNLVPRAYTAGYALHLVVFSDDPEIFILTNYGIACGRTYPLANSFLDDMRVLAQTFAGTSDGPPLYVTLFTEVQTYGCIDNAWFPSPEVNAYYRALKDRYRAARAVFHKYAPNARVSLGWGGWQARWTNPAIGGGRAMIDYFGDVMQESDFQSFQAMQSDSNVEDVRAMVSILGAYGPVMLAHYKPDSGAQSVFDSDVRTMLTDIYLDEVTSEGLFAWSFMDDTNLSVSEDVYRVVRGAVGHYGASAR